MRTVLIICLLLPIAAEARIWEKQYDRFTVWLDCENHGAIAFKYELDADQSAMSSSGSWSLDDTVPVACQPRSTASYRTDAVPDSVGTYDRGHLVPANHMDDSADLMDQTYVTTNALPQHTGFNGAGGAWFRTEVISECYRDITPLSIWGGVIWDGSHEDDFFLASHGVYTPDFWWKLIHRHDQDEYIAWIFPNGPLATDDSMDDFNISIAELKAQLEYVPDFGDAEEATRSSATWPVQESGNELTCEDLTTDRG